VPATGTVNAITTSRIPVSRARIVVINTSYHLRMTAGHFQ
jgi:hypothetical protein